jgi:hypothetical protein
MKKISTYLASALLMLVVLSSCSSRPEDINVADLKEPCDFVDAAVQVLDAIIEITEDVKSPDLLTEDDKKHIQTLSKKLDEIVEVYGVKFDTINEPNCLNTEELIKKRRKVDDGEFREIILSARREYIKAEDLIEPCDFVEAYLELMEAGFEIMKSVDGDYTKLSDSDKKRGEDLQKKEKELRDAAREKNIDPRDCEDYKAYEEKMEELQEKMRELK